MIQNRATYADFEELESELIAANTPFSPSHIHGMMSSLLCVLHQPYQQSWERLQAELTFLRDPASTLYKSFYELFLITAMDLYGPDEVITLMLPSDEASLCERLDGLTQWCEGFLRGIKLAGMTAEILTKLPSLKEVISDLAKFREISLQDADEESEEKEKDYHHIVEFIRVGVLLVHAECGQSQLKKAEHFSREIH